MLPRRNYAYIWKKFHPSRDEVSSFVLRIVQMGLIQRFSTEYLPATALLDLSLAARKQQQQGGAGAEPEAMELEQFYTSFLFLAGGVALAAGAFWWEAGKGAADNRRRRLVIARMKGKVAEKGKKKKGWIKAWQKAGMAPVAK